MRSLREVHRDRWILKAVPASTGSEIALTPPLPVYTARLPSFDPLVLRRGQRFMSGSDVQSAVRPLTAKSSTDGPVERRTDAWLTRASGTSSREIPRTDGPRAAAAASF